MAAWAEAATARSSASAAVRARSIATTYSARVSHSHLLRSYVEIGGLSVLDEIGKLSTS